MFYNRWNQRLTELEVGRGFEPRCPEGLTPFQGGRIGRSRTLPFVIWSLAWLWHCADRAYRVHRLLRLLLEQFLIRFGTR